MPLCRRQTRSTFVGDAQTRVQQHEQSINDHWHQERTGGEYTNPLLIKDRRMRAKKVVHIVNATPKVKWAM